ncbi:putative ribonuclease H-like domain-containing protein, partial [Tanacetum coccineum]
MTGNKSYLSDYEEIDDGFVAFGGNAKGGKITRKGKIRTGKLDFEDVYFVKELKNSGCPVTISQYLISLVQNTCDDAGKAKVETTPGKDYILLPLWPQDLQFSSSSKDSLDAGFKPLGEKEKKDAEDSKNKDNEVPSTEEPRDNDVDENIVYGCTDDPNMPNLEEIVYSDDDEDVGAEANITNLDTQILISPIPTTRIHNDHPVKQIIRDLHSSPQTRRMTKRVTNHIEPKKVILALTDPSWIEAMQDELLQNKKDERGIVVRNKARLVTQGYTQEVGRDYDKVFAPVARIEEIRLFLAYASFMNFVVYQMDVKSAFLYGKIEEEVYVFINQDKYVDEILKKFGFLLVKTSSTPMETSKLLMKDENSKDVDVHLYRSMIGSLMYLASLRLDIIYLKGKPKLGLWYPKDSPFDLESYTDSNYASASLDRKSTIGACQFLKSRLISWQSKKQTIGANSTIEEEYVVAASCCGQFWETVTARTLDNGEIELTAIIDGKVKIVTKASIRRHLQLANSN